MPAAAGNIHEEATLYLPRILCLHGGGTNAKIFRAQCRVLRAELGSKFRLCFAEAPFSSQPGPDVISVYKNWGPFRRWLRSGPEHPQIEPDLAADLIQQSLNAAMKEDDMEGATGGWVGLLGFSQGAKICASLLFQQQVVSEKLGLDQARTDYRFAILLAGRGPLVSLEPDLIMNPALVDASQIGLLRIPTEWNILRDECMLRIPTVHVHGMRDPGLHLHRQLLDYYCDESTSRLIEWDGEHRVPIKSKDVASVVEQILAVARETGVQ